ncbi:putative OB-fold protein, contains Zn-ribbon domain [Nocardia amikacinitolerans]|uniref:Zn-ribbon domain-containing OB-fold protein n=1 Tax=Nocardia amikacinitolerans TaxID=756689 RepID=UPI000A01CA5C|nr:OB-fold domain-containing protein [Nocardia amikacinitolerans]MCP2318009.1 putative OB-fold protein, contains Zn-ribbon domain [Nocardia amikacinitolerans]
MYQHTHESKTTSVARTGTLMIRRCGRCDKLFAPLTAACATCQSSELEWVPSAGYGSIVSWRLVHRSVGGPHAEVEPLTTAVVELDEGPWVFTTIEGDGPLPMDESVRVRFQPRPRVDRFPVFVVCADTRDSASDELPEPSRSAPDDVISTPSRDTGHSYDGSWMRAALDQCDRLAGAGCLDAAAKSLIGFAIRWAPFGGATAGELLVTFGVTRRRFLLMVDEALCPRGSDSIAVRELKGRLLESLTEAWEVDSLLSVG